MRFSKLRLNGAAFIAVIMGLMAATSADTERIVIKPDRDNAIYERGELVTFSVTFLKGDQPVAGEKLRFRISRDGLPPQSGEITSDTEPVTIVTEFNDSGFVMCQVIGTNSEGKVFSAFGSAGFDVKNIKPSLSRPDDFDQFWQKQKEKLAQVPMKAEMNPLDDSLLMNLRGRAEAFDVTVTCATANPVRAYYIRPLNATPQGHPAIVGFHGAGYSGSAVPVSRVFSGKQAFIAMDVNAHGIPNGQPPEFYRNLNTEGKLRGYPFFNNDNPEKIYFRDMFLRALRALEFIKSQPEWDGKTLIVTGSSQGGAQALMAAALDQQVSLCVALVPAMCDTSGIIAGRMSGWPNPVRLLHGKPANEDIVRTMQYYDMVNFAPLIKAQCFISVGFIDTTCPPTSVYAMYNQIASDNKNIFHNLKTGHINPPESIQASNEAIRTHADSRQ